MRKILGIPEDKLNHAVYGFTIALVTALIVNKYFDTNTFTIFTLPVCTSMLIGWVWELWQEKSKSGVKDDKDAIATSVGGVLGALFWALLG